MPRSLAHIALLVSDYDEAIAFFTEKLEFTLLEDLYQPEQDKRWVVVGLAQGAQTSLVLARPSTAKQQAFVGNQTGGRIGFFLQTDDFWRDYEKFRQRGVRFVREPLEAPYGTVAVFEDLYGNLWDLIQYRE